MVEGAPRKRGELAGWPVDAALPMLSPRVGERAASRRA